QRFGSGSLGATGVARGRQPRLAVIEYAPVGDGRRKLMLIRRDNVEHLVMTGGPTDVVIESSIVRAAPSGAAREVQPTRVADTLPGPVPLADGAWPPEPAMRPQRPPTPVMADDDEAAWTVRPEPPPRPAPESAPRAIASERPAAAPVADISRGFRDTEPVTPP